MIDRAVIEGIDRVVLGLGGSATSDGGIGLIQALGATVRTSTGRPVARGGAGLPTIVSVDLDPVVRRLGSVELILASDVDNPLVGPAGAATVYGPQKGADPELVHRLDHALDHWADVLLAATGIDIRNRPGAGAAGGAGAPLLAAGLARLRPGVEVAMELTGFADRVRHADVVVVGEGSLDRQSLRGKGPVGMARAAKAHGARVIAIVGSCHLSSSELADAGIDRVYALSDLEPDANRCMADAEDLLHRTAASLAIDVAPDRSDEPRPRSNQ